MQQQLDREKKIRKILFLGIGGSLVLLNRGGSTDVLDIIDTEYIRAKCKIDEGRRFFEDDRLTNLVNNLYANKRKHKVIYMAATVLCHLAKRYSNTFLSYSVAIGDFGLTSLYQMTRKAVIAICLVWLLPWCIMVVLLH